MTVTTPKPTGFRRLRSAFRHSSNGLIAVWRTEEAFRIEVSLLALSLPVSAWLASTLAQALLLVGSLLALVVVEILNTAIEAVVDRIGPERHPLSGLAKDLGSAAVLLTALFPAAVWIAVGLARLGALSL